MYPEPPCSGCAIVFIPPMTMNTSRYAGEITGNSTTVDSSSKVSVPGNGICGPAFHTSGLGELMSWGMRSACWALFSIPPIHSNPFGKPLRTERKCTRG